MRWRRLDEANGTRTRPRPPQELGSRASISSGPYLERVKVQDIALIEGDEAAVHWLAQVTFDKRLDGEEVCGIRPVVEEKLIETTSRFLALKWLDGNKKTRNGMGRRPRGFVQLIYYYTENREIKTAIRCDHRSTRRRILILCGVTGGIESRSAAKAGICFSDPLNKLHNRDPAHLWAGKERKPPVAMVIREAEAMTCHLFALLSTNL